MPRLLHAPLRATPPTLVDSESLVTLLWSELHRDVSMLLHRHEAIFYERMNSRMNVPGACSMVGARHLGPADVSTDDIIHMEDTNVVLDNRSDRSLDAFSTREPNCSNLDDSPEFAAAFVGENHSVDAAADREQDEVRAICNEIVTDADDKVDASKGRSRALSRPKTNYMGLRKTLHDLTSKNYFTGLVVFAIVANATTMGVGVQVSAITRTASDELRVPIIDALEALFLIFFTVELSLRIFVQRQEFFSGHEWNWNLFDATVVGMSLLNRVLDAFFDAGLPSQLSVLRILRILRVIRMLRILRVVKFFKDLRLMILSILSCVKSLVWVCMILFLTYFIFAIGLTQATVDYLTINNKWQDEESTNLRKYFSSLDRSVMSLFQAMLGGTSWGEYVDALSVLSWIFGLMFEIFILFSMLAVLNIVTAVFVQYTLEAAGQAKEIIALEKQEERERMLKALQGLFHRVDEDNSGKISFEELEVAHRIPEIKELFDELSIDANDTHTLFSLLEAGGDGHVDIDELLEGCLRIKNPPSNFDYACMLYNIKFLVKQRTSASQVHPVA